MKRRAQVRRERKEAAEAADKKPARRKRKSALK